MFPKKVFVQLTQVGRGTLIIEGTLLQVEIKGKKLDLLDFSTNPLYFASQCDEIFEEDAVIVIPDKNGGTKTVVLLGRIHYSTYVIADVSNKD